MPDEHQNNHQDVAAIITAMTDGEEPFLLETLEATLTDPSIGQIILCIEEKNAWLDRILGSLKEDPRLEIVHMPMAFLGAVRNHALNFVRMHWVAYCDGDDVWCTGKTFIQRRWADATKSDFVGADHALINEDGKLCAFTLARNIPMPSSWLVRTEIMKQYPFQDSLPSVEDGEWWIRTKDAVRKSRCPKVLLKYRVRSGSLSSNTPSKKRKARIVSFASLPILRQITLLTWCIWLATRQEEYVWLKSWGQRPSSISTHARENS
ncbi:family 2 glycosyl transferase [Thermocoleostomius sinensis]|uniref:Family 2 glycosyl transferase n=1 Tax=Thermocoleostomius sinensis A174 TaxID=2016057 RepID=A0A9E8ZB57_9CYAN|nr:family 2 glycosyl transferase [Thermocoleostomius sinensis]WAL59908.1 family 2 glycosyl transferase [Thermocoleostomius sinensis A174]